MNIFVTYNQELFLIPIIIFGVLHIRAEYRNSIKQITVFKPLTVLFAIGVGLAGYSDLSTLYKPLIIAGLTASLFGDIMLMRPLNKFIFGLIGFFSAHILYAAAFMSANGFQGLNLDLIPYVLLGSILFLYLRPSLGRMKIPVLLYIGVIILMTWQAEILWQTMGTQKAGLALLGAILFCISDAVLSIRRFKVDFKLSQFLVLGTYYPAQILIAFSV